MSADKVSVLFAEYVRLKPIAAATEGIYRKAVERLIRRLGDKPVDAVTRLDAQKFQRFMTKRQVAGRPVSPTTVNMTLRAVKAFFNWLVEIEVIEESPFRRVRSLRESPSTDRPFEDVEIERLIAAAPDDRWRLIIILAATTGMRRGEIMNLTVGDINYIEGSICITAKQATPRTWPWAIKDHDSRSVPITAMAEQFLLRVQASLPDGQPYMCVDPRRYGYQMGQQACGRLRPDMMKCPERNFRRTFLKICRRAQVPPRKFHTLRGSCFSIMAENGLQPHELQKIAGHLSVQTTYRHYVRPRQELMIKARQTTYKNGR
jgi:integrase